MNQQYELAEMTRHVKYLQSLESAPLAERKESQSDYAALLRDPSHVKTLIGYLVNGDYGYGPMQAACRIVESPRMNRPAALSVILAAYETRCPAKHAIAAWKQLTREEQTAVNTAILTAISE